MEVELWAEKLPVDVLLRIGRYLSFELSQDPKAKLDIFVAGLLRRVCRNWLTNLDESQIWRSWSWTDIGARSARTVQQDGRLRDAAQRAFLVHAVQSVEIADAGDVGAGLASFCKATAGLTSLTMTNCFLSNPPSLPQCVGPSLRRLHLSLMPQLDGPLLTQLAEASPNVKELYLEHAGSVHEVVGTDGLGSVLLSPPPVIRLSSSRPSLDASNHGVDGAACDLWCEPLLDSALLSGHVLTAWLPNLTVLSLAGCTSLTSAGIGRILLACSALTQLDLSKCRLVGGEPHGTVGLWSALTAAPKDARGGRLCERLTHLNLCSMGSEAGATPACRDNALSCFTGVLQPSVSFPRLSHLDLSWCGWVDDRVCSALGKALKGAPLAVLSLHACTRITGEGLHALFPALSECTNTLTHVDIGQIGSVEDTDVATLLSLPLHALQKLNMSGCPHIGPATYTSMGLHCPALTELRSSLAVRVDTSAVRMWVGAAVESAANVRRQFLELEALQRDRPVLVRRQVLAGGVGRSVASPGRSAGASTAPSRMRVGVGTVAATAAVDAEEYEDGGEGEDEESGDGEFVYAAVTPLHSVPSTPARHTHAIGHTGGYNRFAGALSRQVSARRFPPSARPGQRPPPSGMPLSGMPLRSLRWWRAMEVGDGACHALASGASLLREIVLDGCEIALTDAGICALASSCPLLDHISLAACPLTDTSLHALARAPCAAKLGFIDLSMGLEYTRKGLEGLFKAAPALHTVRLQRCAGVCNGSLRALVSSCPRLRSLTIRGCGGVGAGGGREGDEVGSTPDTNASECDSGRGDALTCVALDILGRATMPCLAQHEGRAGGGGRLACLGIGAVPAFSLQNYLAFIDKYATQSTCALTSLSLSEGCTAEQVERLEAGIRAALARAPSLRAKADAARARLVGAQTETPSAPRARRHRALLRMEHLVAGLRLEWRVTAVTGP